MGNRLPPGKLPRDLLASLLERYANPTREVVLGARIGEDAAVLEVADRYLVVSTDPITYATQEMGYYVVTVNANDVVTRGARPRWFLMTLLLPEGENDAEVEKLFQQVDAACRGLSNGQPAAVLLDEAIVFADDERFRRMLHILRKAAEKTQVIVLTCRERDYEAAGVSITRLADCRAARPVQAGLPARPEQVSE